jgi:hypothetical protein
MDWRPHTPIQRQSAPALASHAGELHMVHGGDDAHSWWDARPPDSTNRPWKFPQPDIADLYRYIAVSERLGFLIDSKLLTIDKVNELYGDHVESFIDYGGKRFKKKFREGFPPRARPYAWSGFNDLWEALKEHRKVGEPPQKSDPKKCQNDDRLALIYALGRRLAAIERWTGVRPD